MVFVSFVHIEYKSWIFKPLTCLKNWLERVNWNHKSSFRIFVDFRNFGSREFQVIFILFKWSILLNEFFHSRWARLKFHLYGFQIVAENMDFLNQTVE